MALDKYGLGATWEDEEERRRREREAREQQRLGIAGAPLRIEGKPVQYTTPAQPNRETAKRQRIDDELSPYFSEVAKDAGRRVATKDGKATGMLGEYFALRNKVGEETLLARFNTVAALADRYMSHYETSGIIWDMVRSPYSEEQIDFMMRKGSEALYDPSWRHPDVPPVSAAFLKEMGVDPTDELLGREVGAIMQETGGMFRLAQSGGNFMQPEANANIRAPWDYAKSVLGAVGRAGEWFGEKVGGALEYLSPEAAAERELDTIALNRAKDKGIDERFARFTMPGYEGFQNFISAAHNIPTDDLAAMQREIQKDEYDENNNIVREGYGEGLEPNGMMTTEWRYAFEKDWRRRTNETMQLQRMLLVKGYVGDNLEIDANIQTPEWQEGIARYTNQMAKNAEWMADDPMGFATAQAIGDPRTDGGWTAFARRLLSHGGPQAVYGSGVTIAKAVAGGVAAAFAEADLAARAHNSPTTKQVVDNAWEYLSGKLTEEEQRKFLLFGRPSEQRQEIVKTLQGLAESDPVAKQHLQAINVELGMLITQRFRPNIYTTVGHMVELPYGEVEKSYQNNLDAAEGFNVLAEIVGSGVFGGASRASRALRPLERTEVALANSARATRIVDSTIAYIRDKDFRKAAEELQGTHAPKVVKTVDDAVHGRNTTLVRDMWQDLAEKTEQAIKSGDAGSIEKLFPHVSDAAEFIGDVKKRAGVELDKTTKPTRLNLEKPLSKRLSTEIADLVDSEGYTTVLKTSALKRVLKPGKNTKPVTLTKILALIEKDIPDPSARAVVTKELVQRVDDLGYDSSALRKLLGMDVLKPPDPVGAVNKALRSRQRATGDIVNLDDFAKRTIYDAWTGGPERRALDVLTRLEIPNIGNPGRIWRALDSSIDATSSRQLRGLWYAFTKPVRGAPLPEVELWRPDTSKRIWDYAFHASNGDAAFANTMTNRYIRIAATNDLTAAQRLGDQLIGIADKNYVLKHGVSVGDELDVRLRQVAEADPELYRLANERPLAVDPKTGKAIGSYTTNDGLVITPPQDTVYQMNKLKLGRAFMWAERKVPEDATKLAETMIDIDNWIRKAGFGATELNNRFRAWTVGARPQLFFKHGIVDTARSFVNDWQSILRPLHNHRKFSEWMDTLDADSANFVRAEKFRGHMGELLYNMGQKYRKFKAQRVWDMDARGPFPRRLNKAADSYRRMAGGKVYRAYATGGEKAVREYLATDEGLKFLREGGHLKRAVDELAEIDIVGKHKKPKVDEWAIDNYVDTYVRGIFEGLDEVAPDVADTLKRMAKNETPLNTKDIKKAIKEAGPDQNPYLSIEQAKGVMELGGPTVAASRRLTGIWMTPNKMNRDVTFNRVFNQTMDKLTKEGIDPNSASVIAAHAARATTERVHFDLANALWVEQKHRWYAWFGTKHRLYATYLARMAAENPTLTLPITGIVDWMEARNAKDNVQEWDEQKLRFSMFGQDVEVNLHTLTWLAEYPLQSAFGHLADLGMATAVSSVGYDMKWDPGTFGISFGAQDSLVRTMYEVVTSPAGLPGGEAVTEDQLTEWLQALPPDKQEMWNRSINLEMAEARLLHDEDIEPVEAYNRAVWRTMKHEFWNAFRPFPGSFVSEGSKERNDIMHRYMKASPSQRSRMLKNEPALRYLFGLEEDTATMFHLDEAMVRFNELRDTYSKQVLEGDRSGKLYTDPEEWKRISAEYNVAVDALKRENPYFAKHMSQQWDATFEDRMQLTWPLVDIPTIFEAGRPRTEDEKTLFKQSLTEAFVAKLEDLGMTKDDSNHPYYQRLREDMVDRPMREYTGYDEADPSWKEVTIARYMARGGAAGVAVSMSYKRIIESKQRTDYLQAGLLEGRPVDSRPWMAMLSTEQKYRMGWNSSRKQEERWLVWSETKAQLEQHMAELKINSTSKEGKAYLNGTLEALAESWKTEDPDWYREWQVSQLGLLDRMRLFGFGDGDRPIDSSWTAFMDTMEDMQADIDAAKLKTLDGKKAGPIADEYLARILALKEEDEQWWKAFKYIFTMSDFGFGKWRLPGGRSDILFSSEVE